MNRQPILTMFCGIAIASVLIVTLIQSSHAAIPTIDCVTTENQPTTRVTTFLDDGKQEVVDLRWYKVFKIQEARRLCQQATQKMRRYAQTGQRFYINRGQESGKLVICLGRTENGRCNSSSGSERLLAPIPTNSADKFLSDLLDSYVIDATAEGGIFPRYPNRRPSILGFPLPF